jgi:hypothetical protein
VRDGFPLCNTVFLLSGCERDVEVVNRWEEIGTRGEIQ